MPKILQFDWRLNWTNKVAPHLEDLFVRMTLEDGMQMLSRWQRGEPPYDCYQAPKGSILWYQPRAHFHFVTFFSMTIGALNYPKLDWRFLSGDRHAVPVGYGADGMPRIVMDILLFDSLTAEESIAATAKKDKWVLSRRRWRKHRERDHAAFVRHMLPLFREAAVDQRLLGQGRKDKILHHIKKRCRRQLRITREEKQMVDFMMAKALDECHEQTPSVAHQKPAYDLQRIRDHFMFQVASN